MDISRRSVLGILGAGLGSVGLAAATGKNNSTSTTTDNEETEQAGNQEQNEHQNEGSEENEQGEQNESEDKDEENEDDEQNEHEDNGQVGNVALSEQQAKDIATQEVRGGTVREVELEIEDDGQAKDTPVYNVVIKTTSGTTNEVTIDANSGDVVNVEQED